MRNAIQLLINTGFVLNQMAIEKEYVTLNNKNDYETT